ncbi:site-specific integrase [Oscillibacter sp. CU971]|uniref:tyrosine-type recombinase/integrase n=1 Tax=Oscillibacter sp. CU971 TaxID=2780102 RepID=UPI00195A3E22|nr:site-specific integrase [Oscillibacter sp. CU971]
MFQTAPELLENQHILTVVGIEGVTVVKKGLSPNSVIKHHAMIRTALQWAVKHRYIRENVADFAEKPSHVRYRGAEPYTVQEIANLLQLTASEPIAVPIFLASFYGLRRSELLGLRWSAIDFKQGTITISTTVVKEKHNGEIRAIVRENTTKSDTSMRTLPLCQYTYQYFMNLQQHQAYQRDLCGACYDQRFLDFVCVDQMGTLIQPDYVSQKFQQILSKYGLRRIRFHDLRHSCATIMLYLNYSLKDIQGNADLIPRNNGRCDKIRERGRGV